MNGTKAPTATRAPKTSERQLSRVRGFQKSCTQLPALKGATSNGPGRKTRLLSVFCAIRFSLGPYKRPRLSGPSQEGFGLNIEDAEATDPIEPTGGSTGHSTALRGRRINDCAEGWCASPAGPLNWPPFWPPRDPFDSPRPARFQSAHPVRRASCEARPCARRWCDP